MVGQEDLQNKANRYYFKDIIASSSDFYTSQLDLNVEHGKIQEGVITIRVSRRFPKLKKVLILNITEDYFKQFLADFSGVSMIFKSDVPQRSLLALLPGVHIPFSMKGNLKSVSAALDGLGVGHPHLSYALVLDFASYRKHFWLGLVGALFLCMVTLWAFYKINKSSEESLLFSNLYRQFIDKSFILSMTDLKGRITYVNDNFCTISGYEREEILGKDHRILNSGYHDKSFFKEMWTTIKGGGVFSAEICNLKKDGGIYWVHSNIAPLFDAEGKIFGFASVRYDVTEKRYLKQELDEREKEKKVFHNIMLANIGRMSAGLSHQFSTPISVLSTSLDLLEEDFKGEVSPQSQEVLETYLKNMRETLEDMIGLTSYIKQLSRVGAQAHLGKEDFSLLSNVISSALALSEQKLKRAGVEVLWNAKDFDHNVFGNELLLSQIFINLIENSVFEIKELSQKWIKIWADDSSDELKVFIQDSGPTPALEVCEEMFTPYFSTKDLSQGTGLGLALCKEILNRYNGSINIIKDETHTTFELSFQTKG